MDSSESSRGILDVDLVSASHLQTLLPTDLLSQHIVHGNLADMINSQAHDYATHHRLDGQYLSDQYETSDLLSHTDLTEEDRKLAAALVAVQLVQQQKQQCNQEGVIVNVKNDVVTSMSQLTHPSHSSVVIESLNNSHSLSQDDIPSSTMDEYDAQELMENDLADASVKLFNSINNHTLTQIRLPPLKKTISHSIRNIPLTRYNLINHHELNDPHTIITSNGVLHNTNMHNNSIRTNYGTEINTIDLGNKLLLHNNSLDLTQGVNRLSENINSLNVPNGIQTNIMNAADSNILSNASHEHIHIVNAGTLVNGSIKILKKSLNGIHINGDSLNTNMNNTIVKEEMDFDIKNIKCDDEEAEALSEHLNTINNSRYSISDSDGSDVPTKRTRHGNNNFAAGSTNSTNSSSRSLPHKKRISRRLKTNNVKKTSINVNSGGNSTSTSNGGNSVRNTKRNSIFSCQLCGDKTETQLDFFRHLKLHYEPEHEKQLENKYNDQQTQYMQISDIIDHEQNLDSPLLRASLTEPHTILPNLDEDSLHTDNLSGLQDSCNSITSLSSANDVQRQRENQILENEHDINLDTLPNLIISNVSGLRCKFCSMTFRRHSSLEGHIRETHFKEELQDEFSEPEDLMEGIRSVVEASGGHCSDEEDIDNDMKMDLMESEKHQRDWYQADELHATEVDLQEIEAEQSSREQQNIQQRETDLVESTEFTTEEEQVVTTQVEENAQCCSFICALCGDTFESRELYYDHEIDCQQIMCSDSEVVEGKSVVKPLAPKLSCLQCDRQFNHRNSLMYHIQSHSEKRPYQCEVCGNSFFATSALKVHMRRHSGDKPYQCPICNKFFRQWSDLKYHMVSIHSDVRQYQCEFCGKDFARKYSLIVHRRIHTGEKNYKCEFCAKTFRASSYLQNHRRIHTGEKPYPCEICGKPFRVRGDMKRHMSTHARERNQNGALAKTPATTVPKTEEGLVEENDKNTTTSKMTEVEVSNGKLQVPKLECVTTSNFLDEQDIRNTIEIQGHSENSGSPVQPMNLNITSSSDSTSKSDQKECSLELQVQLSSDTDPQNSEIGIAVSTEQVLHRYTRGLESTDIGKDGNTVYLWPVYMT